MQAKQFKHEAIDERSQDKDKKQLQRKKIRKKYRIERKLTKKKRTNNNKIKYVTKHFDPDNSPLTVEWS